MISVLGWLLATLALGLSAWALFKRAVDQERARKEVGFEIATQVRKDKEHEAEILAMPAGSKRDTLDRMRANRDLH